MNWFLQQLRRPGQPASKATKPLRRELSPPERLESRNAPGAVLPLLPTLESPFCESPATSSALTADLESIQLSESPGNIATVTPTANNTGQDSIEGFQADGDSRLPESSDGEIARTRRDVPIARVHSLARRDAPGEPVASFSSQLPGLPSALTAPTRDSTSDPEAELTHPPSTAFVFAAASVASAIPASESVAQAATRASAGLSLTSTIAAQASEPASTNAAETSTTGADDAVAAVRSGYRPAVRLPFELPSTDPTGDPEPTAGSPDQITTNNVGELLSRAAGATSSEDAIIAIVDRGGHILGVHVEQNVRDTITDNDTLVFAIDGAIAKARTAAFFSNNQAPLTSRTVRFISQTTITQREVQSNPNVSDQMVLGPGFVAPIGVGGHFPPEVDNTPHVDLFAIEHTNRDSLIHPGADRVKAAATVDSSGTIVGASGDDIFLSSRFGADFATGQEIDAPESYGVVSGLMTNAQSRGIATLPGGVPLYKTNTSSGEAELVGGIGVFFPGPDGFADHEQGFVAGIGQSTTGRTNSDLVLESEYIAALVADNSTTIDGIPPVDGFELNLGRIDLVGITLETLGPHPGDPFQFIANMAPNFAQGGSVNGVRMQVNPLGDLARHGEAVPEGWLVDAKAASDGSLSAAEVQEIIDNGVAEAELVRSAIRLPLGTRSSMVLAVTDTDGEVLGLYRMPDSTFFSIDVAVAKARNVAYYSDTVDQLDNDRFDYDKDGSLDVPRGTAFTNRTFRYLAEPRFPSGVEGSTPPPFSTLNHPGIEATTAENLGAPAAASSFVSVLGFDAFNPSSNFSEPVPSTGFQNGVVFFPGSTPLFNGTTLVGGFGVSGDGVDQDDVVTFFGAGALLPRSSSGILRADQVFVGGVRLPYQKFLRNPHA